MKWILGGIGWGFALLASLAHFGALPNPDPSPLYGIITAIYIVGGFIIAGISVLIFKIDELIQKK